MESVAASSTPDDSRSPRRWRKVKRRAGHAHIAIALAPLLLLHVWIGVGLAAMVVRNIAFPFVWQDVDARLAARVGVSQGACRASVTFDVDGVRGEDTFIVDCEAYQDAACGTVITQLHAANIAGHLLQAPAAQSRSSALLHVLPQLALALFWNFIVWMIVWTVSIGPLTRYWLVRRGVRTTGVVDDVKVTRGKGTSVVASFHFDVPHGGYAPAVETKSSVQGAPAADAASTLAPGARVTVYYHPRFPKIATIDALCSYDVVG